MSPTEAPPCGASLSSPAVDLASRVVQGLSSGLEAFVLDKRVDDYDLLVRMLTLSGVRGLLLLKDLGTYAVVYLDREALERKCMYDACSASQSPTDRRACARRCVAERLRDVIRQVSESLCEAARSLTPQEGGSLP